MELKIFFSILLIWSNFEALNAQFEFLVCNYFLHNNITYACKIEIYNPTGLKIFNSIEGVHLENKTDEDVTYIPRDRVVTMPNYPAIILRKFRNTEKLELANSIFERMDDKAFQYCRNLLHLDFSYNKFYRLEDNVFKNCKNLTYLNFLGNQITEISGFAFSNLTTLSTLILSSNPLESFTKNIFKPLVSLTLLDANSMKLKVVHSDSFGGHRFLTTIFMHRNQINAFDERIIDNTAVNLISLAYNPCMNFYSTISDTSVLRTNMKSLISKCFQNYKNLTSGN